MRGSFRARPQVRHDRHGGAKRTFVEGVGRPFWFDNMKKFGVAGGVKSSLSAMSRPTTRAKCRGAYLNVTYSSGEPCYAMAAGWSGADRAPTSLPMAPSPSLSSSISRSSARRCPAKAGWPPSPLWRREATSITPIDRGRGRHALATFPWGHHRRRCRLGTSLGSRSLRCGFLVQRIPAPLSLCQNVRRVIPCKQDDHSPARPPSGAMYASTPSSPPPSSQHHRHRHARQGWRRHAGAERRHYQFRRHNGCRRRARDFGRR